jgi:flagellar motor switch protein FliM
MINQRFARLLRIKLFNLIRRNPDITVDPVSYQSYSTWSRNVPTPTNLNLVTVKPLKGTALFVFPPAMVFMVVDNLFGGDGRFMTLADNRDFTATEQRIIQHLLKLATDAYEEAWSSTFAIKLEYLRSEMQAKYANITNSPTEVIVSSTFHLDVGNSTMDFQVCLPWPMIEPLRELLSTPGDKEKRTENSNWNQHLSAELKETEIELVADFISVPSRISHVLSLKIGDILPIDIPAKVKAHVDGVPVLECGFGSSNGKRALSVIRLLDTPAEPEPDKIGQLNARTNKRD